MNRAALICAPSTYFAQEAMAIFTAIPPRPLKRSSIRRVHICASGPADHSPFIRLGQVGERFMGRRPKPKSKTQNQLLELNKENRRLREIVAYLSEIVLTSMAEKSELAKQPGTGEAQ